MAKRFTDTDKWKQKWYRLLSPKHKAFYDYINSTCDNAGFWHVDFDTASYLIGAEISEDIIKKVFRGRIMEIRPDLWFVADFIEEQYGLLDTKSNPHKSVIKILRKHDLLEVMYNSGWVKFKKYAELPDGLEELPPLQPLMIKAQGLRLKDKDKDKAQDKNQEQDKEQDKDYLDELNQL